MMLNDRPNGAARIDSRNIRRGCAFKKAHNTINSPTPAAPRGRYTLDVLTLGDISERMNRSRSWLYANNIVPLLDSAGKHINANKPTPFPWVQLPLPFNEVGERLWQATQVDEWAIEIFTRGRHERLASSDGSLQLSREVR
ncbi:hypothetical protein [Dyella sp. A6]|uniref:hypothetical protein n=1 Tax=Dyella aluminiiresistens TaxID=3069105 RepID=UPI002E78D33C|nr:hypothetical protein [Dyella sp. A6]